MPKRKTLEDFKQEVDNIYNGEYTVLGTEYTNNKTPIKIRHNCEKCNNHIWSPIPKEITGKHRTGCPICNGGTTKTLDMLLSELPSKYEYISGFVNYTTKCTFKCKKCNTIFNIEPKHIKRKCRTCPQCSKTRNLTHEEFLERVNKFSDADEYIFLDKYINYDTPIKIKHKCGNIFTMSPDSFLAGRRCSCKTKNLSAPVIRIYKFLENNNIEFTAEKYLKELFNNKTTLCRYDFFFPENNLLIEYDGEQHFEGNIGDNRKYNFSDYNILHSNDIYKNNTILNSNCRLIRIPYKSKRYIEEILRLLLIERVDPETIYKKYNLLYISNNKILNEDIYYKFKN